MSSPIENAAEATLPEHHPDVSLRQLFQAFFMLGISSFGGGLSGWIHREIVEKRKWISMDEFLTGLSLARTMPGINVVNLAIWIGYRLRKGVGSATAATAVLSGPLVLIIVCALLYHRWGQSARVHQVLLGITAAALALNISMAFKALRPATPNAFYAGIVVVIFITVGLLHWPMLPVIAALAPLSIGWAFFKEKAHEG